MENYLQMSDGKNDRVREVDFVRVLVDGSRDNRGVDNDRVICSHGFTAQLHAGILGWKVDSDVFVQDERYPDLTCKRDKWTKCSVIHKWPLGPKIRYMAKSMRPCKPWVLFSCYKATV